MPDRHLALHGPAGQRGANGSEPRHRLRAWYRVRHTARAQVPLAMSQPGSDAGALLDTFIAGLGMPRSLGAVKIGRDSFQRIAEQSMRTPWVPRNPRRIDGPAHVREILEFAA